jgi:Mlc titration factor MtfA (ptsG expression regulator)
MLKSIYISFLNFFSGRQSSIPLDKLVWEKEWSVFLEQNVSFYRVLSAGDKKVFEQRVLLFWQTTKIEGGVEVEVNDQDRLLVAASAIIPVWAFKGWHYFNLKAVFLLPAAFNANFECGRSDSLITGMVGVGPMSGKMALSRPALHLGFKNSKDKKNVGIHEFVHLIDMSDGECDGFPESLHEFAYSINWFELVNKKIADINYQKSNIHEYGGTNRAEFLAVASEYFFERPKMLKKKHPELYHALQTIYKNDVLAISNETHLHKKSPCPCGSGKRYKRCCMPKN